MRMFLVKSLRFFVLIGIIYGFNLKKAVCGIGYETINAPNILRGVTHHFVSLNKNSNLFNSFRHNSSSFIGKYVQVNDSGNIKLLQRQYPNYLGNPNFKMIPKHLLPLSIFWDSLKGRTEPFILQKKEGAMSEQKLPEPLVDYLSPRGIRTLFHKHDTSETIEIFSVKYSNIATIDRNLFISRASNFLIAQHSNRASNVEWQKAAEVKVYDEFSLINFSCSTFMTSAKVFLHCFIHPRWKKHLDPAYDIAFVFLSKGIDLTHEQLVNFFSSTLFENPACKISFVGQYEGILGIKEFETANEQMQVLDSARLIYYDLEDVDTNSDFCLTKINTHQSGIFEGKSHSDAVLLRADFLPFLESSIEKYQSFLSYNRLGEETPARRN